MYLLACNVLWKLVFFSQSYGRTCVYHSVFGTNYLQSHLFGNQVTCVRVFFISRDFAELTFIGASISNLGVIFYFKLLTGHINT